MKFERFIYEIQILFLYRTALHIAIKKRYPEIVSLLLSRQELDLNIKYIKSFDSISKFYIQFNSNSIFE